MRKIAKQSFVSFLFAGLMVISQHTLARDPGGNATNGFDNNGDSSVPTDAYDPGKKERESKKYKKKYSPSRRDYYEKGGKSTNHDSACRARIAYKAATYGGPKNGYDKKGKPEKGGGKYGKFPKDPKKIIRNIYKYVEDMLYPRKGSGATPHKDKIICKGIEDGAIDIGLPYHDSREGFACIVAAHFFTSLVRELGFPAREKNITYSNAKGIFSYQTAAANVWYGDKWHFFDPWESFRDYRNYLNGTGHAHVSPKRYHDAWMWIRKTAPSMGGFGVDNDYHFWLGAPPTDSAGWGGKAVKKMEWDGSKVIIKSARVRTGVRRQQRWIGGTMPDGNRMLAEPGVIYVQYDDPIPHTRLDPLGPETYGFELLTLLHDASQVSGEYPYTIAVTNTTDAAQEYEVEIEGMPATREVSVEFLSDNHKGVLQPGVSLDVAIVVTLGDPLELPPEPVIEIGASEGKNGIFQVYWQPVEGAIRYRVYRTQIFQEEFDEAESELIIETAENNVNTEIGEDDFIMVLAVNELGLVSELDFETGSVFVWDPDYQPEIEDTRGNILQTVLLLVGMMVALWAYMAAGYRRSPTG